MARKREFRNRKKNSSPYLIDLAKRLKTSVERNTALFLDCSVCLTKSSALETIVLPCQHITCQECLIHYIRYLVTNKQVETIVCPKDGCELVLTYNLIKSLIPEDLLEKYDEFLMEGYLETSDDIIYCPKAECRCPIFITPEMISGLCPKCEFSFCPKCGDAYHGCNECNECNEFVSEKEKKRVVKRYINGSEDEKNALERRYNKKKIEKAVEEIASEKFIRKKFKQCPQCGVNIEKIKGCNKMSCSKCKTYFCWLCLEILDKENPYKHFSFYKNSCYL